MYKKDIRNALLSIVNHPTAMKVWLFLWDYMRKTGEIDMPTQEYIANRLGTKRQVIGRALKKLRDEKIIEQYKNRWYYNPFLFMVGGMSDKDRYEAQQRWEAIINVIDANDEIVESSKKGWCRMYPKDYAETMIELSGKKNAMSLWWFLVKDGRLKKDGTIRMPKQKYLSEKLNIKQPHISKALKELKDVKIIEEYDGEWYYNPFIQGVNGQSDKELSEAQQRWEKLFGYYESK